MTRKLKHVSLCDECRYDGGRHWTDDIPPQWFRCPEYVKAMCGICNGTGWDTSDQLNPRACNHTAPEPERPESGRICPSCDQGYGPVQVPRMSLHLVPVKFDDACGFVSMWHRHHQPPVGHKFSVGVAVGEKLVGVVMVGRPVARAFDDGSTLEVVRSATDGTPNVNSMLYAAAWRAASALGYRRLVTYTQEGESGSSLRAAGWRVIAQRPARPGWSVPSRPREDRGVDGIPRTLWEAS